MDSRAHFLITIVISIFAGLLIWFFEGDYAQPILLLFVGAGVLITLYHEKTSFLVMLFTILLLEQFPIARPFDNTITVRMGWYYLGNLYKVIPLNFLKMNVLEIHLAALLVVVAFKWRFRADRKYPKAVLLGVGGLFLALLLFTEARGLLRGGDFLTSLWELRALTYLPVMLLITPLIIRSERDVRLLFWVIFAGIAAKTLQGLYYFIVTLGARVDVVESILAHEDSHFFNALFIFLYAAVLLKYKDDQVRFAWLIAPGCFVMFILNERRVTYGTLALGMLLVVFLLDNPKLKRRAMLYAAGAMLVLVPYAFFFWNSWSTIALPIRQVKSIFDTKNRSNAYRDNEKVNLVATITDNPLGIGFGNKYKIVVRLDDISKLFPLWDVIPHNSVLGFWTKAGTGGFIIFWVFFGGAIAESVSCYRSVKNPYLKLVALVVMTQVVGQVIVSYYDLQLNYYRNMIFLGAQLGILPTLRAVDASQRASSDSMSEQEPVEDLHIAA